MCRFSNISWINCCQSSNISISSALQHHQKDRQVARSCCWSLEKGQESVDSTVAHYSLTSLLENCLFLRVIQSILTKTSSLFWNTATQWFFFTAMVFIKQLVNQLNNHHHPAVRRSPIALSERSILSKSCLIETYLISARCFVKLSLGAMQFKSASVFFLCTSVYSNLLMLHPLFLWFRALWTRWREHLNHMSTVAHVQEAFANSLTP